MSIRGAIFDIDGTLFDSMFIWDTIGTEYLRSIGYEPKEKLNETFKAMSLYQAACYYKEEYGVTLSIDEIISGVNKMIEHDYHDVVQLKNGVAEFLEQLKKKDVKMCIATATDRYLIQAALKRHNIDSYFSEIFTCTSVGHGKDEPIIYHEALKHLQSKKNETIVFEDALYAIKTAKADGFITIGIFDLYENSILEVKNLSDYYMNDFSDFHSFWKFASKINGSL
ncbi:MAG: HAD family phosphatase [Oscillospiraceae bacterium]